MGDYVILIQMIIFAASTVEKIWNQEKKYRPLYKAHTSCQNLKKELMGPLLFATLYSLLSHV